MSRKLLLCGGENPYFLYNYSFNANYADGTFSVGEDDVQPLYPYGYLMEAKGRSAFPGSTDRIPTLNFHKVAEYDMKKNKYKYTIESKSADGMKVDTVSFYLDHLLDEIDRTTADVDPGLFADRLYWDENYGEYMLEIQTAHKVYDDSDGWIIDTGDGNIINIELDTGICLYPNGASTSKPCIKSNYRVVQWANRIAMNGSWNQRTLSWINENTLCYGHMLGDYPTNATKEQLDALFIPEMHIVYAIEKQLVRTGIKKKIKIPLFGEGTTFALKNVDSNLSGTEVIGSQTTFGYISMEVICTDAIRDTQFQGEGVSIPDDMTVDPKGKVYFLGFDGKFITEYANFNDDDYKIVGSIQKAITLGERIDDNNFLFKIVAKSADGSKSETVEFTLPDMVCPYGSTSDGFPQCYVQWSDNDKCYVYYTNSEYILLNNLDTFKYGPFRKCYVRRYLQWDDKPAWRTPVMDHIEIMPTTDPSESSDRPWGIYVNADKCEPHYVGGYQQNPIITWSAQSTSGGYTPATEEDRIHTFTMAVNSLESPTNATWYGDRGTVNNHLAKYPIELILPRVNSKTLTPMLTDIKKKIELPYFGPGTTYSLEKESNFGEGEEWGSGHVKKLVANIRVSAPIMQYHDIIYDEYESYPPCPGGSQMDFDKLQSPLIKELETSDIVYSKTGYIKEIRGKDIHLDTNGDGTYEFVSLFTDNFDGTYNYSINIRDRRNTVLSTIPLKMPYRLNGYKSTDEYYWEDRMYWDESMSCYMIEKNTYYMYIDTAYGDVEFKKWTAGVTNFTSGNCWEFPIPAYISDHIHHLSGNYSGILYEKFEGQSNYSISSMMRTQYSTDKPYLFDPDSWSTFDNQASLVIRTSDIFNLDDLDAMLKEKPLVLILPLWYKKRKNEYGEKELIKTSIKKQITIPLSKTSFADGVRITVDNPDGYAVTGHSNVSIPIEYNMVTIPTPTYSLGGKVELDGTSTVNKGYIDTGVKLFDTAKDATVLFDFESKYGGSSLAPDNGDVAFHCRYESSSYKYRGFALVYNTTYNTWCPMGNTTYNNGNLGDYANASLSNSSSETYYWRYRYLFIFKQGVLDRMVNLASPSIYLIDKPSPAYYYDDPLFAQKAPYGSYTGNAIIGRKGTSNSNYNKCTVHDCKIWLGTAFNDAQIQALYDYPIPSLTYEFNNLTVSAPNDTGIQLFNTKRDFTIFVELPHTETKGVIMSIGAYYYSVSKFWLYHNNSSYTKGYEVNAGIYVDGESYSLSASNEYMIPAGDIFRVAIMYKNGVPHRLIHYTSSTGRYEMPMNTNFKPWNTSYSTNSLIIGGMNDKASSAGAYTSGVTNWTGTINKLLIFDGEALDGDRLEYVEKRMLHW